MTFYNDYRPHKFSEVVGQDQVINILHNQAKAHKFHHSYLMSGPSGTGKTTTARILAAALNCATMNGDGEPCGICPSCQAIQKHAHWDVLEVDAPRFRGIDDIKDLCYKAYFTPLGKYKVYIIDECHMLTEPAWAALLKLIEEPPPYLVIILCTTEYNKVPETITSRCQQYPFVKLKESSILGVLKHVCHEVGITPKDEHLTFIAQSSNGNMRTSLNTLEQVVVMQ